MIEAEESLCPLKAMKLNKKSTEDEINAFKHDFKESFSTYCTNYFTGIETCIDVKHRRCTRSSRMKEIFDAAKLLSMEECVSEFAASDKIVKENCTNDVVGSGHAPSDIVSSRKKCAFALNDTDGACFCKNTIKTLLSIGKKINTTQLLAKIA